MIKLFICLIFLFLFGITYVYSYVNMSSCGTIDGAFLGGDDEVRLNSSLSIGSGNCIDIVVDDFILDCKAFLINSTDNSNTLIGIDLNNYDNITIQNCDIRNFGDASGEYGLYSQSGQNILLQNLNLSYNYDGFRIYSSDSIVRNINSLNNLDDGLELGDNRINLSNLIISYNINHGILRSGGSSSSITIINSEFNNNGGTGFAFSSSIDNSIFTNLILSNNIGGGISLSYADYNIFDNIIVNNNTNDGIYLTFGSSSNIFKNFVSNSNLNTGLYISRSSSNNTFINADIRNNIGNNIYFRDYFGSIPSNNTISASYLGTGLNIDSNYNFTGVNYTNSLEGNYWDNFDSLIHPPYCYDGGLWSFCDNSGSIGPPGPEPKSLFPLINPIAFFIITLLVFLSL